MAIPSERAKTYAAAIKAVKYAAAGFAEQCAPLAQVVPRWIQAQSENLEEYAGLLRSPKHLEGQKKLVHTICFYYAGLNFADPEFSTVLKSINPIIPIGVTFYQEYFLGTTELNAEDQMMEEIALVQFTLAEKTDLGLNGIAGHAGLRPGRILPIPMGNTPVLVSVGILNVHMMSRQTVGGAG